MKKDEVARLLLTALWRLVKLGRPGGRGMLLVEAQHSYRSTEDQQPLMMS